MDAAATMKMTQRIGRHGQLEKCQVSRVDPQDAAQEIAEVFASVSSTLTHHNESGIRGSCDSYPEWTLAEATLWVVNVGSVTVRDWINDQTYEIYRAADSSEQNPVLSGWATVTPGTTLSLLAHINPSDAPIWPLQKPMWASEGPAALEFSNPYGAALTQVFVDESGSYTIAASSSWPCLIGLWATTPPLALVAVDANNDGVIEFDGSDATGSLTSGAATLTPFRFWVDDDGAPVRALVGPPNPGNPTRINRTEVLENYCRLHVVPPAGFNPLTGKCTMIFVKHENSGTKQPSIRVFEVRNEDLSYLTSPSGADAVANDLWTPWGGDNSKYPYTTVAEKEKAVSVAYHDPNRERLSFLFAGVTPGKGKLVVRFRDADRKILAEGAVWIELLPIDRMFDRAHISFPQNQNPPGFDPTRDLYKKFQWDLIPPPYIFQDPPQPPKPAYVFLKHFDHPTNPTGAPCQGHECPDTMSPHPREKETVIIYTHGIWELERDFFLDRARKTFKRLYWSGYNGRFVAFHWANLSTAPSLKNLGDKFAFNRSEYNAFICADTFKDFVADVRTKTGYQSVNVMAHSQGNIMVSEAIKLGANVTNYVLMEAAVSASCYDSNPERMPHHPRLDENSAKRDKKLRPAPDKYRGYFQGIRAGNPASNTAGNIVNFFSEADPALQTGDVLLGLIEANWVVNQIQFKPDGPFRRPNGNNRFTATYAYSPNAQQQWQSSVTERKWTRNANGQWEGPTVTWTRAFPAAPSYEELAFVARSRTRAIGAIEPANVPNIRGAIKGNVDLRDRRLDESMWFGRTDHSGQFSRPIQKCFWFYQNVLKAFRIDPIDQPGAEFTNLLQMNQ